MIIAATTAGVILTWLLVGSRRRLARFGLKRTIKYHLISNSLEFLVPFTCVACFYLMLWVVVIVAPQFASVRQLLELESFLSQLKSKAALFKLTAVQTLLVLVGLFALSLLATRFRQGRGVFRAFDTYKVIARRVYTVAVLLCSFTLFGTQLGQPTSYLVVRIKTIREDYADVCREVESIVSEQTADRLYRKALGALPPTYHESLGVPRKIGGELAVLRTTYQAAQREYQVRSAAAESLLRRQAEKATRIPAAGKEPCLIKEGMSQHAARAERNLDSVTSARVRRAKAAVKEYRSRRPSKLVTLLQTEGGKRLACQLPKILTEAAKNKALDPVIEAYPIAEAIVDVFRRTIDDQLEVKVEDAIERATQAAMKEPKPFEDVVAREADGIAESTVIEVSKGTVADCRRAGERLRGELESVRLARAEVDRAAVRANDARVSGLIAKLSHRSAEVRTNAANKLASMGDKLTESHARILTRMMRTGRKKWSTFLYREEHCSWYEDVSAKYYAAVALDTESRYVPEQVRNEARRAQDSAKSTRRVVDAGWI